MTASTRLRWIGIVILASVLYGVFQAQDPNLSVGYTIGYISGVLSVLLLVNCWKKP